MKTDKRGNTDFIHFPAEEVEAVMVALRRAEKGGDLLGLQWLSRRLLWLYDIFKDDPCGDGEPFDFEKSPFNSVKQFNAAYKEGLKNDPPPTSIAPFIIREDEPESEASNERD